MARRQWPLVARVRPGFDRIANRIAGGNADTDRLARCTAELALHEIIATGDTYLDEGVLDVDLAADLPDHGEDDCNFHLMREVLFDDHDVLMLFNPRVGRHRGSG